MPNKYVDEAAARVTEIRAFVDLHPKLSSSEYDISVQVDRNGFDRIRIRPYNREDSEGVQAVSNPPVSSQ